MNLQQVQQFMLEEFPQNNTVIESVGDGKAVIRQDINDQHLRPGGTVSGPTLMGLADCAMYVAIQGVMGPEPLAVTTSLNINFLTKPQANKNVIAQAELIKIGKRLVVGEVMVHSQGNEEPVAIVTATYSVPPKKISAG